MSNKEEITAIILQKIDNIISSGLYKEKSNLEGFSNNIQILENILGKINDYNNSHVYLNDVTYKINLKGYVFNVRNVKYCSNNDNCIRVKISCNNPHKYILNMGFKYSDLEVMKRERKFKELL